MHGRSAGFITIHHVVALVRYAEDTTWNRPANTFTLPRVAFSPVMSTVEPISSSAVISRSGGTRMIDGDIPSGLPSGSSSFR